MRRDVRRDGSPVVNKRLRVDVAAAAELPDADATGFCRLAREYGVEVLAGPITSADGGFDDHVRISLVGPPARLRTGVERLAEAWRAHVGGVLTGTLGAPMRQLPAGGEEVVEVTVPGTAIRGRVTDAGTGEPIAGATVEPWLTSGAGTVSDAEGRCMNAGGPSAGSPTGPP